MAGKKNKKIKKSSGRSWIKFLFAVMLTLAAGGALIFYVLWPYEKDFLIENLKKQNDYAIKSIASASLDAMITQDTLFLERLAHQAIDEGFNVKNIRFENEAGEILFELYRDPSHPTFSQMAVQIKIDWENENFGTMILEFNDEVEKKSIDHFLKITGGGLLALALVFGFLFSTSSRLFLSSMTEEERLLIETEILENLKNALPEQVPDEKADKADAPVEPVAEVAPEAEVKTEPSPPEPAPSVPEAAPAVAPQVAETSPPPAVEPTVPAEPQAQVPVTEAPAPVAVAETPATPVEALAEVKEVAPPVVPEKPVEPETKPEETPPAEVKVDAPPVAAVEAKVAETPVEPAEEPKAAETPENPEKKA